MKKLDLFYMIAAVYCAALVKGTECLIQQGVQQSDITWWVLWTVLNSIVIGRISIYMEYKYSSKETKKTTKKKSK